MKMKIVAIEGATQMVHYLRGIDEDEGADMTETATG